jgi:hypothetical protein
MENNIQIFDETYYGNGYFDFVKDMSTREFLQSAHNAITLCELWDWLRIYQPTKDRGFMWSKTPELDKLNQQMWKDPVNNNHSGSSYGFIMREMEDIAKNGYENYKNRYY